MYCDAFLICWRGFRHADGVAGDYNPVELAEGFEPPTG
jgi:hypothetical protein